MPLNFTNVWPEDIKANRTRPLFTKGQVVALFVAALVLRLAYLLIVILFDGNIDNGSDSGKYIQLAVNLLKFGAFVTEQDGVFVPDIGRMPIYPYFVAIILDLAGENRLWAVALVQAVIDSSTIFATALLAGAVHRRWALPAALIACVWASLIVSASFVLADTLFMSFFTWGLCACAWAARRERKLLLLLAAGVAFGLAAITRPTLIFFPLFLLPALTVLLWSAGRVRWHRAILLAALPVAMILLTLTPRIAVNYASHGVPFATTQSGNHAVQVVESFIRVCPDCVIEGRAETMQNEISERLAAERADGRQDLVLLERIRRDVALKHLLDLPISALIRGTLLGATRSTLQTGLYESGHQFDLKPQFLSVTTGPTFLARLQAFGSAIASDGFLMIWAVAQAFTLAAFLLQVTGTAWSIRNTDSRPFILFLLVVAAYFIALNGPFGNPRYGLPLSPVLIVLTASGALLILDWHRRRRTAPESGQ